jgi:hypothetical protein
MSPRAILRDGSPAVKREMPAVANAMSISTRNRRLGELRAIEVRTGIRSEGDAVGHAGEAADVEAQQRSRQHASRGA